MADTFDPFDLPSAFDPLATATPPPPRRRREAAAATAEAERPMNPRLAHLLPAVAHSASDARRSGTASDDADTSARFATLEDEVAILTARFDDLLAIIDHKLADHQDRLLRAVAAFVAQHR